MASSLHWFIRLSAQTAAGVTRYLCPFGGGFVDTTAEVWIEMPFAATLRNLRVASVSGFGGSSTTAYTLNVNSVASSLVATVNQGAGSTSGSDLTHSVNVVAGDKISLSYVHAATASTSGVEVSACVEVTPTSGDRDVLCFCAAALVASTAQRFTRDFCAGSTGTALLTTETFVLAPGPGTLRNLRVSCRADPTGIGNVTWVVRVNGVDTAVTTVISEGAIPHAGSDTTHSVGVVAGDRISVAATASVVPLTNGADFLISVELTE